MDAIEKANIKAILQHLHDANALLEETRDRLQAEFDEMHDTLKAAKPDVSANITSFTMAIMAQNLVIQEIQDIQEFGKARHLYGEEHSLLASFPRTIIRLDINYDTPKDAGPAFEAHETRIFIDTPEGIKEAARQACTINDPQPGEEQPDIVANEVEIFRCTLNAFGGYVCQERLLLDHFESENPLSAEDYENAISGVSDDHPSMD